MDFPIIAATLGAFLIILQQSLMLTVGMHRALTKIGVGYGEDLHLERKVRRHGNLAENAAIFVVLLALAELHGISETVLFWFAVVFAAARVSHALGFMSLDGSHNTDGNKLFLILRAGGAFGSVFAGIGLGGYLLFSIYAAG